MGLRNVEEVQQCYIHAGNHGYHIEERGENNKKPNGIPRRGRVWEKGTRRGTVCGMIEMNQGLKRYI